MTQKSNNSRDHFVFAVTVFFFYILQDIVLYVPGPIESTAISLRLVPAGNHCVCIFAQCPVRKPAISE